MRKDVAVMNANKFTKEYLLDIVNKILRYIVLMGNKNEVITTTDSLFSITYEPLYRNTNITFNAEVYDADKGENVTHRFENVFRTDLTTNETTYTKHEYEPFIETYTEDCDEKIGNVTIHHKAGEKVVKSYITYDNDGYNTLTFTKDGVRQSIQEPYYTGDPEKAYQYYDKTIFDDDGAVIHMAGDVVLDINNNPIFSYRVYEYDTMWLKVKSETETV